MGLYDREYYRDEYERRGIQLTGPRSAVAVIIVINAVLFLANLLFTPGVGVFKLPRPEAPTANLITYSLALTPDHAENPLYWYSFLTYAFVHDPNSLFHLLFNMLALFFLGPEVERKLGTAEFVRFYLVAAVFASIITVLLQVLGVTAPAILLGASGAIAAVIILFILNFPRRTLYIWGVVGIPAWALGVLIVVLNLLGSRMSSADPRGSDRIAFETHLAGMAFAAAYFYLRWNLARVLPGGGAWKAIKKKLGPKPKLQLHNPEEYYEKLDAEADRILAKMHREGEESLTDKERRTLADYSRRMQQKHR